MPARNETERRLRSALAYLRARARFGMKLGLEATRTLMAALGRPERACPTLLIAGTNGKGSVAAYAAAGLRASGLRVGLYTSPHLVRLHERIVVDGRPLSDRTLADAIQSVREAATRLVAAGALEAQPTHFEVVTAAAFLHFRRRRVDVAVLEVGLGGRLDATNVSEPLVSAIVSIGLDHESHLGHTLARIAREKAGVLRSGRSCVLGPMPARARRTIEGVARRAGARLVRAERGARLEAGKDGLRVVTPARVYRGLRTLPGRHQQLTPLAALRLLEEARRAGLPVELGRVGRAFAAVRWPGRLQRLGGRPRVLLDGAHNPAGAGALARYLREHAAELGPLVLVFGAMADKHVEAMARVLFPLAREIVLTRPPQRRACTPVELARRAGRPAMRAHRREHVAGALALARRLAGPAGTVVVAGSLYLVGEVLKRAEASRRPRGAPPE